MKFYFLVRYEAIVQNAYVISLSPSLNLLSHSLSSPDGEYEKTTLDKPVLYSAKYLLHSIHRVLDEERKRYGTVQNRNFFSSLSK